MISATLISRHIVQPINNIDLDHPKTEKSYKELAPLLRKLRKQNGKVNRQMIELRQKREQFDIITESMSEGLIIADQKANILASNASVYLLLGIKPTKEQHTVFSLCHNEEFRRCIQNAMGGMRAECLLSTEGGERKVIASPANNCGSVTGFVAFILDVTEQQKLETMRREFTSNVSHELKTPLTSIYGIADMMESGMVKKKDIGGFAKRIRDESARMITLIEDIIRLSRLDDESFTEEVLPLDLYEIACNVKEQLSELVDKQRDAKRVSGREFLDGPDSYDEV
jgi:two-component system phosphate regulon sensor histidine kinase PhoR